MRKLRKSTVALLIAAVLPITAAPLSGEPADDIDGMIRQKEWPAIESRLATGDVATVDAVGAFLNRSRNEGTMLWLAAALRNGVLEFQNPLRSAPHIRSLWSAQKGFRAVVDDLPREYSNMLTVGLACVENGCLPIDVEQEVIASYEDTRDPYLLWVLGTSENKSSHLLLLRESRSNSAKIADHAKAALARRGNKEMEDELLARYDSLWDMAAWVSDHSKMSEEFLAVAPALKYVGSQRCLIALVDLIKLNPPSRPPDQRTSFVLPPCTWCSGLSPILYSAIGIEVPRTHRYPEIVAWYEENRPQILEGIAKKHGQMPCLLGSPAPPGTVGPWGKNRGKH